MWPNLHSEAILDTQHRQKSLRYYRPAARITNPEELPSGSGDQAFHPLAPNHYSSLCLETSIPKPLLTYLPGWGLQNHTASLDLHSQRNSASLCCPNPPNEEKPTRPLSPPQFHRPLWKKCTVGHTLSTYLPKTRRSVALSQNIEPDMPLGPHRNPSLGFQPSVQRGVFRKPTYGPTCGQGAIQ